jgi:hypothetical protein
MKEHYSGGQVRVLNPEITRGQAFEPQWLLYIRAALTFKISAFCISNLEQKLGSVCALYCLSSDICRQYAAPVQMFLYG